METTRRPTARSILYTLSGGAISVFFVLAAAQQAQAAPAPHPPPAPEKKATENKQAENRKAVDSGLSGRNEQTGKKQRQTAARKADEKKQVEDRKRVNAGASGRDEQTGKKQRAVKAEQKKADDKKKVEERKRVDASSSGRNEQSERGERKRRAEKKAAEDKKKIEERKRVDAGASGRNEQTGQRERQVKAEQKRRADEKKIAERKAVDAGPSGRNEQTGKLKRKAEADRKARADEYQRRLENRRSVDAGPSGRNEQTGRRAARVDTLRRQSGLPGARPAPSSPPRDAQAPARLGPGNAKGTADLLRNARAPQDRDKNLRDRISEQLLSWEESIEQGVSGLRGWAEGEIDKEKSDPDKLPDLATGLGRVGAGAYASVHDDVHAINDGLETMQRAGNGDAEAQRQVERASQDAINGVANAATEAWNDPRGTLDRAAENARQALDDFGEAPLSGTGGLLAGAVGAGKITRPARGLDAVTPDRPSPEPGRPDEANRPAGEAPPDAASVPERNAARNTPPVGAARSPRGPSANTDSRPRRPGDGADAQRRTGSVTPDGSRPGKSTETPAKRDDGASSESARSEPDTQGPSDTRTTRDSDEAAPACAVKNSFVPGTPVLLADGTTKPIEQVKLGDRVLATDPVTGVTEARPVTDLIPGQGLKELVRITVDTDGDRGDATGVVTATGEHPFWVAGSHRWTDAEDLVRGDRVRTPDGRLLEVVARDGWTQQQRVHNFTVEGLHTYYVLAGAEPVLVHNDECASQYEDITNPGARMLNKLTDVGPRSFGETLEANGFTRTDKGPNIMYEKNGTRYFLRGKANSHAGWTADYFKPGSKKADIKIRLGED
ncbi:polymorphic toxin-type HINT domain-containing protein [Amycolatopsis magusensis]|uniref:Hint domain-containing protein n=1 Tax=Amycolatopsis magusensis TaxID=882444 RepID=A0ABS4PTD9_9PSEU|nr:polymorphic toxin-type HINT domain-containing protein [Amycolatopsis magusensis]MBP2182699.1 hypothetical protein [Amycolatopsis magusensis]